MRKSAEKIATELGGSRSGSGWIAKCPAHKDSSPSLSIGVGRDGRVLVHCFAGCTGAQVIQKLQQLNLWSDRNGR